MASLGPAYHSWLLFLKCTIIYLASEVADRRTNTQPGIKPGDNCSETIPEPYRLPSKGPSIVFLPHGVAKN